MYSYFSNSFSLYAQISSQLSAALKSVSIGQPFTISKLSLSSNNIEGIKSSQISDVASKLKELAEINKLLKGGNTTNKKIEGAYDICKNLIKNDFEQAAETIQEHILVQQQSEKSADVIACLISNKQKDLPEKYIVFITDLVLTNFGKFTFSQNERALNKSFAEAIIEKESAKDSFALASALFTLSITKNNLIKELRRNQIKNVYRLLEIILILLQHNSVLPNDEEPFIPSFEQLCDWLEAVIDAYYLNFCLKEDWKDILDKIDVEIQQKSEFYEQIKGFNDSVEAFAKCSENIKKAINKNESDLYVKQMYL